MKKNYCLVITVAFALIFNACKKKSDEVATPAPPPPPAITADEPLTTSQAASLAATPDTFIRLDDIILENGQDVRTYLQANDPNFLVTYPSQRGGKITGMSPREQKNMYMARLFAMGNFLVNDANHTHSAGSANEPAQTGLAYSWGSKDYNKRQAPPTVRSTGCNTLKIYGLDCTGMVYIMTTAAALPPVQPKSNYFMGTIATAAQWTNSFKFSQDYNDLEMINKGPLTPDKMKNGDMILWGRHIGIYIYGWIYQSNGDPDTTGCYGNLGAGKGPRCISITEVMKYGFGSYKVFRVEHGVDYEITFTQDLTSLATGGGFSGHCSWAPNSYKDSAVVYINIKNNVVKLDKIENMTPYSAYSTYGSCDCLSMTFNPAGIIDISTFLGELAVMDTTIFTYDMTVSAGYPEEVILCHINPATDKPETFDGAWQTILVQDIVTLPHDLMPVVYPWSGFGTMTIKRVE